MYGTVRMSVLLCTCGFSAGTRSALDKHLLRFEADKGHGLTDKTKQIMALSDQYASFDKDGDKNLDLRELTRLLRKGNPSITDQETRILFQAADIDKDGLVSFDEFLAHVFAPPPERISAPRRSGMESLPPSREAAAKKPSTAAPRAERAPEQSRRELGSTGGTEESRAPDTSSSPGKRRARLDSECVKTRTPERSMAVTWAPGRGGDSPFAGSQPPLLQSSSSGLSPPGRTRFDTSGDLVGLGSSPGSNTSRSLDGAVRFLIVRHGRSANKSRNVGETASSDPELSEQGYDQAEALGTRLADDLTRIQSGDIIVASSPMRRCLLTIRPAVFQLNIAPGDCIVHGGCYEFGCAGLANKGTPANEIADSFPEFSIAGGFNEDGTWEYQGSSPKETPDEARARAVRLVDWIWDVAQTLSQRPSRRPKVFVLSLHQTLADLICQLLLDGTVDNWQYGEMKYKLQNTGITEIMLESSGRAKSGVQNDFAHLKRAAIPTKASLGATMPNLGRQTSLSRTSKQRASLRAKFSDTDCSGNHKLDFQEMSKLLRKGNPGLSDEELWRIFNAADVTNDGDLDFDEFLNYVFGHEEVVVT